MAIKNALLYISPLPGGEMTARFVAGLAHHLGIEITGLTCAFDVAYQAGLYTRVLDESLRKLREKNREDAIVAMTHARGIFDQGTSRFINVMETCSAAEATNGRARWSAERQERPASPARSLRRPSQSISGRLEQPSENRNHSVPGMQSRLQ